MSLRADPANPFHRASFWIEKLKYPDRPRTLESVEAPRYGADLELLLREAGIDSLTGPELVETCEFYAHSLSRLLGVPLLLSRSIFLDGVIHGIAFAARLEADQ